MKLRWMPEAEAALAAIEAWTSEQDSVPRAKALMARIVERAEILPHAPRLGRRVQPENRDDLRVTHERPYWIYYRIAPDAIEILLVWHYRQIPPDLERRPA